MIQKQNVIFLDIDGVLCTTRACIAVGNTGGCFSYLDPIACLLVKRLCDEHNARIVISSSWRLSYDMYAMQAILNAACAGLGDKMYCEAEIDWKTSSFNNTTADKHGRGREIYSWLQKHDDYVNNFCIIDDDCDMEPLMSALVRCNTYDGICFDQYIAAEKILACSGI